MLDREKFVSSDGDAEDTVRCCTGCARARARANARQDKPSGNRQQFSTFARGGRRHEGEKASSAGSFPPCRYPTLSLGAVSSSPHLRPVHLASSSLFVRLSCARLASFCSFYLCLYTRRLELLSCSYLSGERRDATRRGAHGRKGLAVCGLVRRSSKV